jgi:DNA-nicking Smr family endonuclease
MNTPSGESDAELFRRAMRGVKPLHYDRIAPQTPKLKPMPRQRLLDETHVRRDMLSDAFDPADLETGEELVYLKPGVQHSTLRKLRRGQYSVRAELDLHGLFAAEARVAVADFLHYCRDNHLSCVRIIHGKGYGSHQKQPVLKNKLNHWLRQHDHVLAFSSARAVDGGTGAVYVLIQRR